MKKHQGSQCGKCKDYFEKVNKCPKCGGNVMDADWYSRRFVERYAFSATVILIGILAAFFKPNNVVKPAGYIFLPILGLIMMYRIENFLGASKSFLGLTEKFHANSIPANANAKFFWKRYFLEFLLPFRIVWILLKRSFVGALLGLVDE